jgi:hypothetical protein
MTVGAAGSALQGRGQRWTILHDLPPLEAVGRTVEMPPLRRSPGGRDESDGGAAGQRGPPHAP